MPDKNCWQRNFRMRIEEYSVISGNAKTILFSIITETDCSD